MFLGSQKKRKKTKIQFWIDPNSDVTATKSRTVVDVFGVGTYGNTAGQCCVASVFVLCRPCAVVDAKTKCLGDDDVFLRTEL